MLRFSQMAASGALTRPSPLFTRLAAFSAQPLGLMTNSTPCFGFASRLAKKRIYVEKSRMTLPKLEGTKVLDFKKPWSKQGTALRVPIKKVTRRAIVTR